MNGDLLIELNHHEYIVWTVKLWLNTLFTASYDCSVVHITFKVTENNFEVVELNKIQGPAKWADAMGADATGTFMATHDEDTFQLDIWNLTKPDSMNPSLNLNGHTDEVKIFHTIIPLFKRLQASPTQALLVIKF